jgi:hypothetical protein
MSQSVDPSATPSHQLILGHRSSNSFDDEPVRIRDQTSKPIRIKKGVTSLKSPSQGKIPQVNIIVPQYTKPLLGAEAVFQLK